MEILMRITCSMLFISGLLVGQGEAQRPQITLPGTTTRLTGIYIPFNESQYLNVDTRMEAFLGIPFAEPPVGELRLKNPIKKGDLGRTYLAITDRPQCPQTSPLDDIPGNPGIGRDVDEDCLYLAVHTSSPRPITAPVVVWFHGGGYSTGAGSATLYEPLPMIALAPDIVFVTVNYRLGVYGFLTTGDSVSPGNYGMFDQVMALEWVQDNIVAFGGDPSRVTIMGESAGASSVGLHLMSPISVGLFHQAIMQSGNALCPWAVDTDIGRQVGFTREIADQVNCTDIDSELLIECLRDVDEPVLTQAQASLTLKYLTNELLFTPVVDQVFIPDLPVEILKRQEFQSVPMLTGTNEDEGTLITLRAYPSYVLRQIPPTVTREDFTELLPDYLFYYTPMFATAVEQWYLDWTQADDSTSNQVNAFINLNTDQMFACPTEAMSRAMLETGAPVYRYEMTHDPTSSIFIGLPGWLGAGHAEELQYVFAWGLNQDLPDVLREQTNEEKSMSIQFMQYWANFIRTGNPNGEQPSGEYPEWPRYTLPEQNYKKLSPSMENGRAMRMNNCTFWLHYAPALNSYGDFSGLYKEWEQEYTQWRDVHMVQWTDAFDEYKSNEQCGDP
ncbi:cholinesterase 1-like [Lytechinus variegatus]|uniref:cholinesterase 1-like n=1 Tax=Lytechinus variegatus TaxID=7654 RepID=UPI001BB15AF9|nr:cholinesterase 1-like [Lytechinus variegatus]XP_041461003.1 cholinesterase 1-like [Lytechinus variegatus]